MCCCPEDGEVMVPSASPVGAALAVITGLLTAIPVRSVGCA